MLSFYLMRSPDPLVKFPNPEECVDSGNFDTVYACSLFGLLPMASALVQDRASEFEFWSVFSSSLFVVGFPLLCPGRPISTCPLT